PSQRKLLITHTIIQSLDPVSYPSNMLILPVHVTVLDTNVVLLSELKVNPPGPNDAPFEFIELRGPAGKVITNLWLVALQGNASANPGQADFVLNLTGRRFGTNGLLLVAAPGNPYRFAPATSVVLAPQLANPGGAFDNGTFSLLLVGTTQTITEGADLDIGNNGIAEGLPADTCILDAVGWSDGGNNDKVYGGVDLTQPTFTPDAASRLPGNNTPRSAAAWMVGDLSGANGESLAYDPRNVSTNLPAGSIMSPGIVNKTGPTLSPNPPAPVSGVIGDPENQAVFF